MVSCNEVNCPCKNYDCENHGKCCDCVKSHREKGYLPACLREIGNKEA